MFILTWMTPAGEQYQCLCAGTQHAWEVYWALRESMKAAMPVADCWIRIVDGAGHYRNPEAGPGLPPVVRSAAQGRYILKAVSGARIQEPRP